MTRVLHRADPDGRHLPATTPEVVLCHGSIVPYDAIGNDIAQTVALLQRQGVACYVYGECVTIPGLPRLEPSGLEALIASPKNVIIYHHSIGWPAGEGILRRAAARIVIVYHNVTPPHFFELEDLELTAACGAGRAQTERLKARFRDALWITDSAFNLRDAGLDKLPRSAVVPPFHLVERWRDVRPTEDIVQRLVESEDVNLLAVGRLVRSKGVHELLHVVADYRRHHGRRVRLWVVGGGPSPDGQYVHALHRLIDRLNIGGHVHLVGQVPDEDLLAYYLGSDYLLCMSDHEGFCVPLVEAQYLRLPVIAKDIPAVRETLGDGQLLLGGDPIEFAEAIVTLQRHEDYRSCLVDKGADVNSASRAGWTALMSAAWEGHTEVVKLLLQKGADRRPMNGRGETALSLAESAGNREAAALLRGAR